MFLSKKMLKFLKNNIYYILVILLTIPAVFALFHNGFYGASDDLHIAWLFEMDKLFKIGQIPPRFVPDLSFGFGYPLFNFVFPFPFYLGELFHTIGLSLVDSVKVVFGISLVFSGLIMFLFLKNIISSLPLSLLGSLIYVYAPYRSTDVYIRGAFGEALSFVFLPLLLYGIIKIFKNVNKTNRVDWRNAAISAFGLGILILTHDIVSYMFFPFFLLLILMFFIITNSSSRISFVISSGIGIVGGLLLSIYFWFPAITQSGLMAFSTVFDFKDHYPTIKQLITPFFGYGASVAGPHDGMSFFLGVGNIAAMVIGSIVALFTWKKIEIFQKIVIIWAVISFLLAFFMMNYRSTFLWNILPFLPYFQFPWRFLTLTTLVSSLFVIPISIINKKYLIGALVTVGSVSLIIFNLNIFKPHDFLERQDEYYLNRYIPIPTASDSYLETQEEYLRLPKNTLVRPDKNYPPLTSEANFNYSVIETNGIYLKANVSVGSGSQVSYNKYYFPGWKAYVDGKEVEINIGKPFGQISINIPKGESIVEFDYKETTLNLFLDGISLLTLIALTMFLVKKKIR
jgi:hypothetical protein